ncbi:MAG TPA: carbon-nitrogen hydrolase family protein [Clostridiaceae bacterium]|nr:carbon-nitrogen hydrolase family protein [Clostridiaceae bacterium]
MKIGVCQLSVIEGQYKRNIEEIEKSIKNHMEDKIDVICFPELCITGYNFDIVKKSPVNERQVFSDLARKYKQNIFAGIAIKEGEKYFDVAAIWDQNGKLLCEYKKIHLWGEERDFFTHGDEVKIFELDGWRIGIMICADLGFADLPKIMSLRGCDAILCPAAWFSPFEEMFKLMVRARACENQVYLVGIDRAKGDVGLCGNSCISNPLGEIIAQSNTIEQDYFEADLNLDEVKRGKLTIPWLKMRLPEIYKKEYNK